MIKDKKITAVIVDDEPLAIEGLRLRLENIQDIQLVGEGEDGDQAIRLCQQLQPDVLFIDLRLPGLSGLEVVQGLQSDSMPLVVFVSAYSEYAIEAFELDAIDYLMKPVNLGRLQKTIERIKERLSPQQRDREKAKLLKALGVSSGLSVTELESWLDNDSAPFPSKYRSELLIKNHDNEQVFVAVKDIQWIDAAGDYMCIHTEQENYVVRITMKRLQEELDSEIFQRIHKSTIVNLHCVKSIQSLKNNESMLDLGNEIKLKVSRNYSDAVKKLVENRLS
ncbi:LytR/AlgR family response regulator transcription factor (plasmid) [Pseudoalteromonas sp. T1lg65]|uniref:LytR/AlgR family response regulator transcription factor n=1 Tax=Pseudoalteromonas sp. T1lg65 TaxID=2077101 RepID=UPI003F79E103